jgi:hypothetical protein
MAGTADGEPDIEDLTFEMDFLLGDLKGLEYDMHNLRVFQQETRALETAAQIPRLQQQIARLKKKEGTYHSELNQCSRIGTRSIRR